MSNDKVMAEFEEFWLAPEQDELRASCAQGWAFKVWKASRAALVVGLPKQCNEGDDYAEGWNNALGWSKAAIEAAGVRVKA